MARTSYSVTPAPVIISIQVHVQSCSPISFNFNFDSPHFFSYRSSLYLRSTPFLPSSSSDAELIQYLFPVGRGPSSKTWPRCAPQLLHWTSILRIPWLLSTMNFKFCILAGAQKLSQPVPESNFVSESK